MIHLNTTHFIIRKPTEIVWDVHFSEVHLFVHSIRSEWFEPVHPELFLAFLLRVCPVRIIMSSHLWPLILKCSPTGSLILFFVFIVERWLLILVRRAPVSPTYCFDQTMPLIDAVVCAARHVAKYPVGATRHGAFKTVLVLCLHRRYLASEYVLKSPFGNGLSYFALTTMSFEFLRRFNAAIGGTLKR